VVYGTIRIDIGFRADLIVEDRVIVAIKSVEGLAPVHRKQLLPYLRLADKRLGLLINCNAALIKDGITRVVNGLEEESHAKLGRRRASSFMDEETGGQRKERVWEAKLREARRQAMVDSVLVPYHARRKA